MRNRTTRSLVIYTVVVVSIFTATMLSNKRPTLGLDLEGGVSVVLRPVVQGGSKEEIKLESLEQTKEIIDQRVNAFGVGEPEISIQGDTILVQLPGIKDQQRVLDQIGKTAELRFRPVLEETPAPPEDAAKQIAELRTKLKMPDGVTAQQVVEDEQAKQAAANPTTTTVPGETTTTVPGGSAPTSVPAAPSTAAPTTAAPTTTLPDGDGTGGGTSLKGAAFRRQTTTTAPSTPSTTASTASTASSTVPVDTTTTTTPTPLNQWGIDLSDPDFSKLYGLETQVDSAKSALTSRADDLPDAEVTLEGKPDAEGNVLRYKLGPMLLTGRAIEDASASVQGGTWQVNPTFKEGKDGIDLFNQAAAKCNAGDPVCPTLPGREHGALAVVLDGIVQSAPSINEPTFSRDQIQITGSFTEQEAKDLALALRFGSLPLILEPQQVQTVSATLGDASVQAGIVAALLGLAMVGLYLIAYYRILGVVVMTGLLLGASMLVSIVSLFGDIFTLTLSGIVGTIVSIGVSLDSSIVYFENLKEDVRRGRTVRSVSETSFQGAFSTIAKANSSSFIAAVVLYVLSVGPVRGFALYLGLSTILDLVLTYFFVRPATIMVSRSRLGLKPKWFGIDVDAPIKPIGGRRRRAERVDTTTDEGPDDAVPDADDALATEGGAS